MGLARAPFIGSAVSVTTRDRVNQFIPRKLGSRHKTEQWPETPCRRLSGEMQSGDRTLQAALEYRVAVFHVQALHQGLRKEWIFGDIHAKSGCEQCVIDKPLGSIVEFQEEVAAGNRSRNDRSTQRDRNPLQPGL